MYTTEDKLKEIERELAMRKRHYPGMIVGGRLTSEQAQRQIEIMVAIAADYRGQVSAK